MARKKAAKKKMTRRKKEHWIFEKNPDLRWLILAFCLVGFLILGFVR